MLAAFDEKPLVRSISRTLAKVKSMITNYHQFKEILKYKSLSTDIHSMIDLQHFYLFVD